MRILALDLGYSALKYTYIDENGKMVSNKIISAAAKLPEAPIEVDNDELFRLGTDWYLLGPSALRTARSYLLPLETFDDMLAVYPAWISYLLKKLEHIKFDRVTIGLSFAFVNEADRLLRAHWKIGCDYFSMALERIAQRQGRYTLATGKESVEEYYFTHSLLISFRIILQ